MKRFLFLPFFLLTFCLWVVLSLHAPALAQEDEVSRLRQRVTELENRIKQLESLLTARPKKGQSDETGWQNKKNWRKLQSGMPENEVKAILGEPIKIIKGVKTLWYYPNLYRGYCSFDDEGRLVGWNEP